jgi:hypothetical protein
MELVHGLIGFIKTVILIVLGAAIGFALGAMTHPFAQVMGIGNVIQMAMEGGWGNMFAQGVATAGIVGAVFGALIGWLIAWMTRRKKPAVVVQHQE